MFLTAIDLVELTERKRAAAQCRALDAMDIPYLVGANGHPRVLRSLVERLMGGESRAMLSSPEPELCLEPTPKSRPPSATVRILQTRRVLAGQEGQVDTPRR
jgi:hypothetical protein